MKLTKKQKNIITVGIILTLIIELLSNCTGIKENSLWDLFDEVQREFFPQTIFNEIIIKDPEKLERRIERDVDKAIAEVESEYDSMIEEDNKQYQPRYIEEPPSENQTGDAGLLGEPMRICAPWMENCDD